MIYVGIDNGLDGGIVALSDTAGAAPVACLPMPTQTHRGRREIDARAVADWFLALGPLGWTTAIIEEPGGSKSANAAASMAASFATLRAVCEVKRIRWHRVTPRQWQRVMLPGCPAGETKREALAVARRLWPAHDWRASERAKTPHDGIVDAALIAEMGRRCGL